MIDRAESASWLDGWIVWEAEERVAAQPLNSFSPLSFCPHYVKESLRTQRTAEVKEPAVSFVREGER